MWGWIEQEPPDNEEPAVDDGVEGRKEVLCVLP
jgi:hypothetical protein